MQTQYFQHQKSTVNFNYMNNLLSPQGEKRVGRMKQQYSGLSLDDQRDDQRYRLNTQSHRVQEGSYHLPLKKQIRGLRIVTERKNIGKKGRHEYTHSRVNLEFLEETQQGKELRLLKEENHSLLRQLMQLQSAYKQLRYRNELQNKNTESLPYSPRLNELSKENSQMQYLKRKIEFLSGQNLHLKEEIRLKDQRRAFDQKNLSQNIMKNSMLSQQIENNKLQLQMTIDQINQLKKQLQNKENIINMLKIQNTSSKNSSTDIISNVTLKMKRVTQERQSLETSLLNQKDKLLQCQQQLKQQKLQRTRNEHKIQELMAEIEMKNKDLVFSNEQSISLDHLLKQTSSELSVLQNALKQKQKQESHSSQVHKLREELRNYKLKVTILSEEIQNLTLIIDRMKGEYQKSLEKVSKDVQMLTKMDEMCAAMDDLREKLFVEMQKNRNLQQKQMELIEKFSSQQSQKLMEKCLKLKQNESIILKQLEWLKMEKEQSINQLTAANRMQEEQYIKQLNSLRQQKEEQGIKNEKEIALLHLQINQTKARLNGGIQKIRQSSSEEKLKVNQTKQNSKLDRQFENYYVSPPSIPYQKIEERDKQQAEKFD